MHREFRESTSMNLRFRVGHLRKLVSVVTANDLVVANEVQDGIEGTAPVGLQTVRNDEVKKPFPSICTLAIANNTISRTPPRIKRAASPRLSVQIM